MLCPAAANKGLLGREEVVTVGMLDVDAKDCEERLPGGVVAVAGFPNALKGLPDGEGEELNDVDGLSSDFGVNSAENTEVFLASTAGEGVASLFTAAFEGVVSGVLVGDVALAVVPDFGVDPGVTDDGALIPVISASSASCSASSSSPSVSENVSDKKESASSCTCTWSSTSSSSSNVP